MVRNFEIGELEELLKNDTSQNISIARGFLEDVVKEYKDPKKSEAYETGLRDAWELAKKIALSTNMVETARIFIAKNVCGIEQIRLLEDCFNLTPREALAKLEAYEEEKEIKVGDIVFYKGRNINVAIVKVYSENGEKLYKGLGEDGQAYGFAESVLNTSITRTGRKIDISGILAEIGKEN